MEIASLRLKIKLSCFGKNFNSRSEKFYRKRVFKTGNITNVNTTLLRDCFLYIPIKGSKLSIIYIYSLYRNSQKISQFICTKGNHNSLNQRKKSKRAFIESQICIKHGNKISIIGDLSLTSSLTLRNSKY